MFLCLLLCQCLRWLFGACSLSDQSGDLKWGEGRHSVYLGKGWGERRDDFSPYTWEKGEKGLVYVRVLHVSVCTRECVCCPGFLRLIISLPV